jgi:uncharacterized protein YbaP (TraB family)
MRTFRLFLVLGLLAWIQVWWYPTSLAEAAEKHLFWKVSAGAAGTAYLLGSIHFGKPSMYPLDPVIMQAFAKADALVVEINALEMNSTEVTRLFAAKGTYKLGDNLRSNLKPNTWQALKAAVEYFGLPIELFQQQRPWFAALTLSALELRRIGYSESLGIDMYFLKKAQHEKPIIELESFAQQIAIFDQFSSAEEEAFLIETLQEIEQGKDYLQSLLEAWHSGDDQAIDQLMNEGFRASLLLKRVYELLLTQRNQAMTKKVEGLIGSGKTCFVVVGAAHLVGETGIVQLFKDKGYQIEQL